MSYKSTTTLYSGIPQDYSIYYWDTSRAQTFVAQSTFLLGRFSFECGRGNTGGAGTVNVYLRATNSGSPSTPSGAILSTGTFNSDSLSTGSQWIDVDMTPGSLLIYNRYAMEVQVGGDVAHNIRLFGNHSKPIYSPDGTSLYGSGNDWDAESSAQAGSDFNYHFVTYSSGTIPQAVGYVGLAGENYLRLISVSDAETEANIDPSLRLIGPDSTVVCADLVPTTEDFVSPVRVYTSDGVKSWRGSVA